MKRRLVILAAVILIGGAFATQASAQGSTASPPAGSGKPATTPPPPAKKSFRDRLYYGGGVGMSFGDVTYVGLSPYLGVNFGHNVSGGIGVFYTYREDNRYDPDLSTNDWGTDLFVRYRVAPQFFLQADYSWTDFEYLLVDGSTTRDSYSGILIGGGFVQEMGGHAAFIASGMYDLNWSQNDLTPYDSPWIFSAGVSVGF